jgi:hypothetical protein
MKRLVALGLMAALSAPAMSEEICDNIDAVAGGWKAVAETVDSNRDAEWSDQDLQDLIETVSALHGGSSAVAELLSTNGNPSQKALGRRLSNAMNDIASLTTESPIDDIVAATDEATNAMIEVTADCDEYHQ